MWMGRSSFRTPTIGHATQKMARREGKIWEGVERRGPLDEKRKINT